MFVEFFGTPKPKPGAKHLTINHSGVSHPPQGTYTYESRGGFESQPVWTQPKPRSRNNSLSALKWKYYHQNIVIVVLLIKFSLSFSSLSLFVPQTSFLSRCSIQMSLRGKRKSSEHETEPIPRYDRSHLVVALPVEAAVTFVTVPARLEAL